MRRWALMVAIVAGLSAPLAGHHSFADLYLESDTIEIEGEIVEFQYVNPHAWIHLTAVDPFGQQKVYAAEWVSTSRLEREGIAKNFLREGERLRVWASPPRKPNDNRIRVKRLERRSPKWQWGGGGANR